MSAITTIYFNGRMISVPGAYSEVDASGLETIGLTASGIVACLGESIGGKPYTEISGSDVKSQLQVATTPQKPFDYFRSGALREAGPILFGPADDEQIAAGAQEIVYVKTNPAVQSAATFSNGTGDALDLTSIEWGYFTTQINVEIGTSTDTLGKMITITFEDTEEVFDDVGGDVMFSVTFAATTPAGGYTTITATIDASAMYASFTLARAGLDTDITGAQVTPGAAVEFASSDAGDTMTVTIYGTDALDAAQSETLTLLGVATVTGTKVWNSIHGVVIASAPAGTVTMKTAPGAAAITTLTPLILSRGLYTMSDVAVAGVVLSNVRSAAGVEKFTIVGKNAAGATQMETVTLTGTVPVLSLGKWSSLTYLALAEVAAAGTVTASAVAVNAPFSGIDTIQKAADKFNGTPGFTFTIVTGESSLAMENMDYAGPTSIKDPASVDFVADLYAIVAKINAESSLVSAARSTGGTGAPDNTAAATYLVGGHEGDATPGNEGVPTSSNANWTAAIALLTQVRVNTIVVMTHDPDIHSLVKAHCKLMGGVGRSERDAKLGLWNTGLTDLPTKTEIKSQVVNINNKYCAAWAQNVERYNTSGEREVLPPMYGACMLAGMQAGSSVGTATTHKYLNTLSIGQDSTWNPTDDAEEMLAAGLCFGEVVDGIGRRVVRGITTHLTSANIAYTEQSVVEAVSYSVYNYRSQMETVVGRKGFAGTVTAAHGEAIGILGLLVGVALVAYRSLQTSLTLDVIAQAVEIAPVLPVNFVKSTVHLVAIPQSAAA